MNYNPYFMYPAYNALSAPKIGLFSRLFGNGINFSSILSGAGKVVNFANQAIPLVKQMPPLVRNAKTMFRVMNEFKKVDENETRKTKNVVENKEDNIKQKEPLSSGPVFFI